MDCGRLTIINLTLETMKKYTRPSIRKVTIDKEISMVMMSPPTEPGVGIMPRGLNVLRWLR